MSNPPPGLIPREPLHRLVLLLCAVAVCLHQSWLWSWYIEDSAITFAYAKNLLAGEGLVPWPGGERVEGFSNPTWLVLIALFQLVGVDGFTSSKLLGFVFGAGCVPFAYALARRSLPDEARDYALVAPIVLSFASMFAIWTACGLENSLVCFLIVGGASRLATEMERGGRPWSAVWFLLVALSRPDGILYAAMAGGVLLFATLRARRTLVPIAQWLAIFWVPFLALVAARLWYFAYPFPMTYYGKVGGGGTMIHRWYGWGWEQMRLYCAELGQVWFLPMYLLGVVGTRGWRGRAMAVAIVVLGLMIAIPGTQLMREWMPFWPQVTEPLWWLRLRVVAIGVVGVSVPFVAAGGDRWEPKVATASMALVTVFFHLYSNADWANGFRWMSFLAAPAAALFAVGVWEVGSFVQRLLAPGVPYPHRLIGSLAAIAVLAWAAPNLRYTAWYEAEGFTDDPFMIQRRGNFTLNWWRRLNLADRKLVELDHDMGGHMYFHDRTHAMMDVAGLIDVPRAMHNLGQRAFVEEYVFTEERPDFIHLSENWQKWSAFGDLPVFQRDYVLVTPRWGPYDQNIGFWVRRDHLTAPAWKHPADRKVNFAGGASLQGWNLPTPELGQGRSWYIEAGFKTSPRKPGEDYRAYVFLADGAKLLAVWELPLGHGILPMHLWRADEVHVGRFTFELPANVPAGTWDLGFAMIGANGQVLPAGGWNGEATVSPAARTERRDGDAPAFAHGEVRFPGAVTVVSSERVDALAVEKRTRAVELANKGDCAGAERSWLLAQRQVPRNYPWHDEHRPEVARSLARCWTARAGSDPGGAVAHLAKAHDWDHREPSYVAAAEVVADRLYDEALEARSAEDWERAYRLFGDVLEVQPTRSWARRYAEEARNHRLGYPVPSWFGRVIRATNLPNAK